MSVMTQIDGRRARGATSRRTVMTLAVDLASVDGLEGLSLGTLAAKADMSKGGVVALFGSKEQLQLATVAAAKEIFVADVVTPALEEKGGLARLLVLLDAWLRYSESRVFAGGCFFAAATSELGSRRGPVRDSVVGAIVEWQQFVRRTIAGAIEREELDAATDAAQLTFEITSLLDGANDMSLLLDSNEPYERARTALAKLFAPA